jgi:hypothetical protein
MEALDGGNDPIERANAQPDFLFVPLSDQEAWQDSSDHENPLVTFHSRSHLSKEGHARRPAFSPDFHFAPDNQFTSLCLRSALSVAMSVQMHCLHSRPLF